MHGLNNVYVQMVPLIKRSADTLVDKFRETAESGESVEVMRYIYYSIMFCG